MKVVTVRFDEAALRDIDRVRDLVPREAWIRRLCADAVMAHDIAKDYRSGDTSHVEAGVATYTPGREGGPPVTRAGRTLAEMQSERPIIQKRAKR